MSVMRSSLLGSLLQVLKFNLDRKAERVRVFELGRVFLRDASVPEHRHHGRRHPPAHARGGPGLWRPDGLQWGRKGGVDFFDVKGDVEALLRPASRVQAREHPAMHPGRCAASGWMGRWAWWVNCTRAGASLRSWPMRRSCSNWTWMLCCSARCRVPAGAKIPGRWSATSP
jgi:hypothetical protein